MDVRSVTARTFFFVVLLVALATVAAVTLGEPVQ